MKTIFQTLIVVSMVAIQALSFAQAPPLGTAAGFVLFSTTGAVGNSGISHITGNVGTNSGSSTGFGNVNGVMHDNDGASAQCSADLLIAYNQLNSTIPTFFPSPLFGNGQMLNAGVYAVSGAATLNSNLTLNAQGDANAVFIFQIQGSFSTGVNSKIKLINGAQACNVFWKVEGMVNMASGTTMRGTIIANNAAISMNTGDTLEGRALSTSGAITVDGVLAYIPVGCGAPVLSGPAAPALASTECYAIFSSNGAVSNTGVTHVTGDVGTNVGLAIGFDPLLVTGTIHPIPDVSTAQCAADLLDVYTALNLLPVDIELLYPAQFGNDLVLTPHTYLLNAATVFTGTLTLDAQGNADAVFVIKINGALSTSTRSIVKLVNGTQAGNVFWKVEGAVGIGTYSLFVGTIVCNNGALGALETGVILHGRALTTTGALSTTEGTITMPPGCCNLNQVPVNTQVTGVVGSGESTCKNATQTITVAGNGTTFQVQNGGSVTMIAGQNIRLLAGTRVNYGGYLHAYITTMSEYCCGSTSGSYAGINKVSETIPETGAGTSFRVYPNPTTGIFYLELPPSSGNANAVVQIYGMAGDLILKDELSGNNRFEFSLAGKSPGIYFLQVRYGDRLESKRIIKK
ncbi:MAG: ice-binding family protein [Bacteroidetes bacterium]|nr:ice-binding family protein [Bacteroidota bacterium]